MAAERPRGPLIPAAEILYRAITHPGWWVAAEGRPSSAALSFPVFSVNLASLATVDETVQSVGKPGCGIMQFTAGNAVQEGFDPRHEIDAAFLDNLAHGHVYCDLPASQRKKAAKRLLSWCQVVLAPDLARLQ